MLSAEKIREAQHRAIQMLEDAQIVLPQNEKNKIEVCDYNLGD